MRIGIDLFSLVPDVGRGGGFHRYTTALVAALRNIDSDDGYVLFTNPLNAALFPRDGRFTQVVVPLPPQRAVWPFRLAWLHTLLPLVAARQHLDLVHFPMDVGSFRLGCPYLVTTNDLISDVYYPAHHPDSVSALKTRYLFAAKRRTARRASRVICPSRATAADVQTHYGVPASRIAVVPDGVDCTMFSSPHRATTPPYILAVLSLSPHKNVERLIDAFALARTRHALPHELHLIGMRGTDASPVSRAIQRAIEAGVPIRHLGFVSDAALISAYAGASLFVFLSRIEGFGLPPLEAMAAGVPVIASNVSSLPDVCGDAAIMVSPDDVDGAAAAIAQVLTQPALADRLVTRGRARAEQFSWAETARRTHDVYREVLSAMAGREDHEPLGQP